MLDVPYITLDATLHLPQFAGLATKTIDLRPACDSGLDEVAHHILVYQGGVLLGMLQHVWPWTDQTHVAPEYIDELGKLVDITLAQEAAQSSLARIVFRGFQAVALGIATPGAELVAPELGTILARALLLEEDRAG